MVTGLQPADARDRSTPEKSRSKNVNAIARILMAMSLTEKQRTQVAAVESV